MTSVEHDLCSDMWKTLFLRHDDVGKRFSEVPIRYPIVVCMDVVFFEDIIHEDGSDSFDMASLEFAHVDFFFILLIFDIAKYFFEDILHGDDSCSSTMLVEDESDMTT